MSVTFTAPGLLAGTDADGEWEPNELWVNMTNVNAVRVADALGFSLGEDGDLYGSMCATKFMGHVLVALALAPADEGMPSHELAPGDPGRPEWSGQARWIVGERRPGYLQDRLAALHALAEWAVANNVPVQWA
jgi:hypothetical protein